MAAHVQEIMLVKAKVKQTHRVMAKVTKAIMGDEGCTGRARVTEVYWEAMHRGRQGDRERENGERRAREEQGAQEAYGREAGELEEALAASLGRWPFPWSGACAGRCFLCTSLRSGRPAN